MSRDSHTKGSWQRLKSEEKERQDNSLIKGSLGSTAVVTCIVLHAWFCLFVVCLVLFLFGCLVGCVFIYIYIYIFIFSGQCILVSNSVLSSLDQQQSHIAVSCRQELEGNFSPQESASKEKVSGILQHEHIEVTWLTPFSLTMST